MSSFMAFDSKRLSAAFQTRSFYLYLIFRGDKLVYIGKSSSIINRIKGHFSSGRGKVTSALCLKMDNESEMNRQESELIKLLRPSKNVTFHPVNLLIRKRRSKRFFWYQCQSCDRRQIHGPNHLKCGSCYKKSLLRMAVDPLSEDEKERIDILLNSSGQ